MGFCELRAGVLRSRFGHLEKVVGQALALSFIHKSKVPWVAAIAKQSVWRQPQEARDRRTTANSRCSLMPRGMSGFLSAWPTQVVKKTTWATRGVFMYKQQGRSLPYSTFFLPRRDRCCPQAPVPTTPPHHAPATNGSGPTYPRGSAHPSAVGTAPFIMLRLLL